LRTETVSNNVISKVFCIQE